jgi:hypothetical protein
MQNDRASFDCPAAQGAQDEDAELDGIKRWMASRKMPHPERGRQAAVEGRTTYD